MGMPSLDITFKNVASTAARRLQRGIVAVILLDSAAQGEHILMDAGDIPTTLSAVNQAYLTSAFVGYVNTPSKIHAYVLPTDAENLSAALTYFETQKINYVAGPPSCSIEQATEIKNWIIAQRASKRYPKAVLPDTAADNEGIINFTTDEIKAGTQEYTTAEYCGRMAGLIAGTPAAISCTYAVLPEVTDVKRLIDTEMDAAVDRGELIIFHDGEKVKVGRGVNSLTTTTDTKQDPWKKIKIVETIDMIRDDLRLLTQDNYFGKYSNIYDHKCLLITAISTYFAQLEAEGILRAGESSVEINMEKQRQYLKNKGVDVTNMTDQEIKVADTGTKVFLAGKIGIPDTMEDVELDIEF